MAQTVFTDETGRLRSGWRAAAFLLAYIILSRVLILSVLPFKPGVYASIYDQLYLLAPFTVSALAAGVLGVAFARVFEDLPIASLGLSLTKSSLRNLSLGCGIGLMAFVIAYSIGWTLGAIGAARNTTSTAESIAISLAVTLVIFLVGALSEELLFRGYLLQTLVRSGNTWNGIILTSALFALVHNGNPGATALSWLNTFLAGAWFALAYMRARDLYFPIAMHFSWNWAQGPIFGVSGIAALSAEPVVRSEMIGPEWLVGGGYGVEGGMVCTAALAVAILLTLYVPVAGDAGKMPLRDLLFSRPGS
jgi:uncharacterized protein